MPTSEYQMIVNKLQSILRRVGMIGEVLHSKISSHYAVVVRATVCRMRMRVQQLMRLLDTGELAPIKIAVLTGDCPSEPDR